MSRYTTQLTKTVLFIGTSLLCCLQLRAQTITEALQKQIWAPTFTLADWENLLPDATQDTVFSPDGQFAECIHLDAAGYPASVTTLALVAQAWQPMGRTQVTFGSYGRLVGLQSWKWENGIWQNESLTKAQDERLQMSYWVDEAWQVAYDGFTETHYATASGNQRP